MTSVRKQVDFGYTSPLPHFWRYPTTCIAGLCG
jgi:hypothetical protein